jgi:hypothetical protein
MKNAELGSAPEEPVDPLDRSLGGPIAPIPGLDVDVDDEATKRVFGPSVLGLPRHGAGHASSDAERIFEYTGWREDAAREGPFSKGHARSVYRGSKSIDNGLALPGLVWLVAVVDQDRELGLIAVLAWTLALVLWTPWTLWRVYGRNPQGDVRRAGMYLGCAWAPLLLLIPAWDSTVPLLLAATLIYFGGLFLLYRALTVPPAPVQRTGRRRSSPPLA